MAKIINLKGARKNKARSQAAEAGAVNRAAFGRPKSERDLEKARTEKSRRDLDAHKREED